MTLRHKVVLITGASGGIGAACARAFHRRGARVSLFARTESKLAQLAAQTDGIYTAGDVTVAADRERAVQATLDQLGRIDVLVNNAGVGMYVPAWKADMTQVRRLYELNLFSALEMIQLVTPPMQRQRGGAIVNVSSIAGKVSLPWFSNYTASKFALCALTDGLRIELKAHRIHCMAVCPGYVKTDFQDNVIAGRPPENLRRSKRFAITAEQCAEAIARGLERNRRTVVTPRLGWALITAYNLFPSLVDRPLERIYRSLDPGKEP